jgi:hypothetical protein
VSKTFVDNWNIYTYEEIQRRKEIRLEGRDNKL